MSCFVWILRSFVWVLSRLGIVETEVRALPPERDVGRSSIR